MVWQDFQAEDFGTCLGSDIVDNGFELFGNVANKYLPAVLRAEHDVEFAGIRYIIAGFVRLRHMCIIFSALRRHD